MAVRVGERLKYDPMKLQFTTMDGTNGSSENVLEHISNRRSIQELIRPMNVNSITVILYEKLDVSTTVLENGGDIPVQVTSHNSESSLNSISSPAESVPSSNIKALALFHEIDRSLDDADIWFTYGMEQEDDRNDASAAQMYQRGAENGYIRCLHVS